MRYIEVQSCKFCPHHRHFISAKEPEEGQERESFDTCAHPSILNAHGNTPHARKLSEFPFLPAWCPLPDIQKIVTNRYQHQKRDG